MSKADLLFVRIHICVHVVPLLFCSVCSVLCDVDFISCFFPATCVSLISVFKLISCSLSLSCCLQACLCPLFDCFLDLIGLYCESGFCLFLLSTVSFFTKAASGLKILFSRGNSNNRSQQKKTKHGTTKDRKKQKETAVNSKKHKIAELRISSTGNSRNRQQQRQQRRKHQHRRQWFQGVP